MIEHLKKSMKLMLKENFGRLRYGDDSRTPYDYIPTGTTKNPKRVILPDDISMKLKESKLEQFPKLSEALLLSLFSDIGVLYLPEICLYKLRENSNPLEVFYDFVVTFGVSMENRLQERYIVDIKMLNRVIGYLQKMDALRKEEMFDSRPIYRLLAQQKFEKVEKILKDRD